MLKAGEGVILESEDNPHYPHPKDSKGRLADYDQQRRYGRVRAARLPLLADLSGIEDRLLLLGEIDLRLRCCLVKHHFTWLWASSLHG